MSETVREIKMLFYLNDNIERYIKIKDIADFLKLGDRQVRRYRDDLVRPVIR